MSDIKPVVLGRISGLFGVKGWVKIHSYTEPRDAILTYADWQIEQGGVWQAIKLAEGKRHGKTVIARFDGVEDRDAAAALLESFVGVQREALPTLENDTHYWADLEGLQVVNRNGTVLGKVAYMLATGANDVLVVQGDQEILIPYVKGDVIERVDLETGRIDVNWEWF